MKQIRKTVLFYLTTLLFCFAVFQYLCNFAQGETPSPLNQKLPAEGWVLEKVKRGELADLEQFSKGSDRVISASFLEKLLTDSLKNVKVHRNRVRIKHAVLTKPVDLVNAEIPHEIWLENCIFEEKVDLAGSVLRKSLCFPGSLFKKEANFKGMKVGNNAVFHEAVFEGPVDFIGAEIAIQFQADGAQFKNAMRGVNFSSMKEGANFNGMKVGETAVFQKAVFAGPVDFRGMKVGETAVFHEAVFEGPVDFRNTEIDGTFRADEALFKNAMIGAHFNNMKVGDNAFFQKAIFIGPVDFSRAEIAGNFKVDKAQFKNSSTVANFNGMKVGDTASFRKVIFKKTVSMTEAKFLDLLIQDLKGDGQGVPGIDLSRSMITRELRIEDSTLRDLIVTSLQVLGPTSFNRLAIEHQANFEHSRFLTLALSKVSWPKVRDSIRLDDMTYQYISGGPEEDSWKRLIELVDQSVYNASNYTNLEDFFWRQGYPKRMDKVFDAQNRRERKEFLRGTSWLWSLLLGFLVRHGRSPHRAFFFMAVFVFIGCIVFLRRDNMEPQTPEGTSHKYNALWYSLDLFLPFIDLHAADVWIPKQQRWIARHYMRVHIILGWILVPIGLAAFTGIIK